MTLVLRVIRIKIEKKKRKIINKKTNKSIRERYNVKYRNTLSMIHAIVGVEILIGVVSLLLVGHCVKLMALSQ